MSLRAGLAILLLSTVPALADCDLPGSPPEGLADHFARYVAKITVKNILYSDEEEPTVYATAFLLTFGGYVVTSGHVVEDAENFKSQKITITFAANPQLQPFEAVAVSYDADADVQLLRLVPPQDYTAFRFDADVFQLPQVSPVRRGFGVAVIGYSAESPSITEAAGCIRGKVDPFWTSDASTNPMSSGSAVLTGSGQLIAIAKGQLTGVASEETNGQSVSLNNVYLVTPIGYAYQLKVGAPSLAPAPPERTLDLNAFIEKSYTVPDAFDFKMPYSLSTSNATPAPGTPGTYTATLSPVNSLKATGCSWLANDAQSAEDGRNAKCEIDPKTGLPNLSVDLDKPTLLDRVFGSSADASFNGTVTVKFAPPPAAAQH